MIGRLKVYCDVCGRQLGKWLPENDEPHGWEDPNTAKRHVCDECHGAACDQAYAEVCAFADPWTPIEALVDRALERLPFPYETYIAPRFGEVTE